MNGPDQVPVEIDFTPPVKRLSLIEDLEEVVDENFSPASEFTTRESHTFFDNLCKKYKIEYDHPRTTAPLIDKIKI